MKFQCPLCGREAMQVGPLDGIVWCPQCGACDASGVAVQPHMLEQLKREVRWHQARWAALVDELGQILTVAENITGLQRRIDPTESLDIILQAIKTHPLGASTMRKCLCCETVMRFRPVPTPLWVCDLCGTIYPIEGDDQVDWSVAVEPTGDEMEELTP